MTLQSVLKHNMSTALLTDMLIQDTSGGCIFSVHVLTLNPETLFFVRLGSEVSYILYILLPRDNKKNDRLSECA